MVETTKMAASEVAVEHATEAHAPYLKVFGALAVLTAVEYYYAAVFKLLERTIGKGEPPFPPPTPGSQVKEIPLTPADGVVNP